MEMRHRQEHLQRKEVKVMVAAGGGEGYGGGRMATTERQAGGDSVSLAIQILDRRHSCRVLCAWYEPKYGSINAENVICVRSSFLNFFQPFWSF
jgi:hypothetical protein